jgi:type VI secretion system secreted protein Hcp
MADMFLWLDGFTGESIDEASGGPKHAGHIEIFGWQWGLKNAAKLGLNEREAAKETKADSLQITKNVDLASATLVQYCTLGTLIKKATLTCRKNAGEAKLEYLVMDLTDVKVMSVKWDKKEHVVEEAVVLECVTAKARYTKQDDETGMGTGGACLFGWNFADNTPA